MAQFGTDATGTYQVQNAVTPQAGVVDQSGEMLLRAAETAIEGGLAAYKTKKVSDIQQEAEAAVASEVGVLQDIFKDGKEPPSLQQYRDSLARANQAMEIGGLNIQDRAMLRVKTLVRKKSSENPWFAQTYAQIGEQVLSNYSDQIGLLARMEDAIQASSGTQADVDKKKREDAIKLRDSTNENPGFDLLSAPIEMVDKFRMKAQSLQEEDRKAEELKAAADQARAERQLAATERGASAAERSAAYQENQREGFIRDNQYGNTVLSKFSKRINSRVSQYVKLQGSGQLVASASDIQKDAAGQMAQIRMDFTNEVDSYPWTDTVEKARILEQFDKRMTALQDLFTGDMSELQLKARQVTDLETNNRLDVLVNMPRIAKLNAMVGPNATAPFIQNAINKDSETRLALTREYEGLSGGALDSKQVELLMNAIESGDLNSVPVSLRPSVQKSAVRQLQGNADLKNPINIQDPATWGKTFLVAIDGEINAVDNKAFTETVLNESFTTNFEKLKTADKGVAQGVAQTMVESFPALGSSLISAAKAVPAENGTLTIDPNSGEFFVERGTEDPKYLVRAANRLNNLMNAMEAVSAFDRRVQGVNPKLWYAENVLGIKGLLEQPAQEQPQ